MCEKIRIRRVSDYPSARGGLEDILIMENMTNHLLLVQIRVNGYLLDFASIEGQRQKHYRLKNLPQTVELTVDDVEEDLDLTYPKIEVIKKLIFSNVCFARTDKSTFKDFQDYLSSRGKIVFWYDFHPQNTRGMCYNSSNR